MARFNSNMSIGEILAAKTAVSFAALSTIAGTYRATLAREHKFANEEARRSDVSSWGSDANWVNTQQASAVKYHQEAALTGLSGKNPNALEKAARKVAAKAKAEFMAVDAVAQESSDKAFARLENPTPRRHDAKPTQRFKALVGQAMVDKAKADKAKAAWMQALQALKEARKAVKVVEAGTEKAIIRYERLMMSPDKAYEVLGGNMLDASWYAIALDSFAYELEQY